MPSYNKVVLVGHTTRDAELKFIGPGKTPVCEFGLAVSDSYLDKKTNEWKENTTFIDCAVWGPYAERIGNDIKKGNLLLVEGKLKMDVWQDKVTGDKRSRHTIKADVVRHLTSKAARGGTPSPYSGASLPRPDAILEDESVPF